MNEAPKPSIGVVILTFNEALHIERALKSVARLSARAFVVDAYSTDTTVTIARAAGAEVVQHAFINYAQQFQWALDNVPFSTDWVMRLDADEELTDELVSEIAERLPLLPSDITGVNLKRRHVFLGRWIKHGGRYPLTLLRLWRKGAARIEQRWMDEHMVLLHGQSLTFRHDFSDINLNDISYLIDKHNKYATREAIDVLQQKYKLSLDDQGIMSGNASAQASRKRMLKSNIYNNLPLWIGPLLYFLMRYVPQRGFLDGQEGLIYHFLQGYWYRFLVGSKVFEFDRVLRTLPNAESKINALERLTGHALRQAAGLPEPKRDGVVTPAFVVEDTVSAHQ